jgi:hypothetical protein
MKRWAIPAMLVAMPAWAETAGPPVPAKSKVTAAQVAITNYRQSYQPAEPPKPCQQPANGEIVVCAQDGRGGSPDRLPLPGELGAPAVRIATGEAPHMGVGRSPVHHPGQGLMLTMKGRKLVVAKSTEAR